MLTQRLGGLCRHTVSPQECMWHTLPLHGQPWSCVGYSQLLAAWPPHTDNSQLFHILQCFRRNTCLPHGPVPHTQNPRGVWDPSAW